MGKGDPKKLRGKMSSYAFFVQTCQEEHKKKQPDASVNFSEFSKKCSEMWKTMSAKDKGKFEDTAKADKAHNEREMKTYIPSKGETKKEFQGSQCTLCSPPSAFFLFCSEYRPKIKGEHPSLLINDVATKLGEMWDKTASDNKQLHGKKAAKLQEKWEKDIAAPVLVVFSVVTNLARYCMGAGTWRGNLKQVLVGAQHKLATHGDGSFSICSCL
uniref:HMG box domain-containing protein n=1 Tax=Ailuropoda melanoleuca TaxID=9646 RepID=G1LYU2_AILME